MYTEDDENVKVKNKDSNGSESDFYTSFNAINEEKKNTKKKKVSKKEENVPQDEEDYRDFYDSNETEEVTDDRGKNNNLIRILLIVFLVIFLITLIVILLNKNSNSGSSGDIELAKDNYALKTGETDYISYKIVGTENSVHSTFASSNPNVVTVDSNGQIKAVNNGEATITIKYTIDGKTKEKKINVKVEGPPEKHEIILSLSPSTTDWTKGDVSIAVSAKSDVAITSLKYTLNCDQNCQYKDVTNNQIIVSNSGVTKVVVIAKNNSNEEVRKEVTVKIDKVPPKAELSKTNIVSNSDTSVCVTCSDSESGCQHAKVCKKYVSSKSNQVITVYDNAGNSTESARFNVTINKLVSPCSLKVSTSGKVTATLNGTYTYYGFDSNYSGSPTLSKTINISASKNGESGAKIVNYYVKNSSGATGTCNITVIKECKCKDGSNSSNCSVTCSFRAG